MMPSTGRDSVDVTLAPKMLDDAMDRHDNDNGMRLTIIKTQDTWIRRRQESLLTQATETKLKPDDLTVERNKAFDLLDAISRSGSLSIDCCDLHAIVPVTHCFENDVIGTVVQDNVNPIENIEKAHVLVASTVYGLPAADVVANTLEGQRLKGLFPVWFVSATNR